jgi:hypothetical protein
MKRPLHHRTYEAYQNDNADDGWYVNEFWPDDTGMIRRETVADGLPEHIAHQLVRDLSASTNLAAAHSALNA